MIILCSNYSEICLGIKLFPGDNGVVMGLEVGVYSCDESFMSLILTSMSLLTLVRSRSYIYSAFEIFVPSLEYIL